MGQFIETTGGPAGAIFTANLPDATPKIDRWPTGSMAPHWSCHRMPAACIRGGILNGCNYACIPDDARDFVTGWTLPSCLKVLTFADTKERELEKRKNNFPD